MKYFTKIIIDLPATSMLCVPCKWLHDKINFKHLSDSERKQLIIKLIEENWDNCGCTLYQNEDRLGHNVGRIK